MGYAWTYSTTPGRVMVYARVLYVKDARMVIAVNLKRAAAVMRRQAFTDHISWAIQLLVGFYRG
jgi:hypothetical protein